MNNLNALPGSDTKIVSTSYSEKNMKGYKNDEVFEKLLLSHEEKINDFLSSDMKMAYSDMEMVYSDSENLLTNNYLDQLTKQSEIGRVQFQGRQESKNIELYDQKSHAIGKLSYIEKQSNNGNFNKAPLDELQAFDRSTKKQSNTVSSQLLAISELKNVKLIGHSLLSESNIVVKKWTKANSLAPLLIKDIKYEREKIVEVKQGDKAKIYIRNYFTPIEELSAVVSQYLLEFKNKVNFIINGKAR